MRHKLIILAVVSMPIMAGCSLYRKPEVPAHHAPDRFKYEYVSQLNASYRPKIRTEWWKNFNDPQLNKLVDLSFKNNYSYLIALKNIDIARTYVTQNTSMLWPQFNLNGNASRNHSINLFNNPGVINGSNGSNSGLPGSGRIYNFIQLFASVSYEIDIWNQVGNSIKQSRADVGANDAASKVVKLTLLNSVIDSYYQIKTQDINIANLESQLSAAEAILNLTRAQYRGGLIDGTGLDDARSQVEAIKYNLSELQKQKKVTQSALAYLLGQYPEQFNSLTFSAAINQPVDRMVPAGLPSQMLSERPDIQQAMFQVLSSGYIEKQYYANFFPTFNITGEYGYASQMLANLVGGNNSYWNIGLNAIQPLFDYKLRSSEYLRAKLQYENAMLNYKSVVLNAFKEVDTALASYQDDRKALKAYQHQYSIAKNKLSLINAQYRGGLVDYNTYLVTRLNTLQAAYNQNNQQLLVLQDILQVYKTLGLGLGVQSKPEV